jgi:predicted glycogen debranching enzyme
MLSADDRLPPLRMKVHGEQSTFEVNGEPVHGNYFCVEQARGYDCEGAFWTPGAFNVLLAHERPVTLVASAESWDVASVISPDEAAGIEFERRRRLLTLAPVATRSDAAAELVLAADQFLITPAGRYADATRARAVSDEVRTVIAGYHWFTDWGRDTMIALEGLTLVTGRHREAGFIVRTFARYVRDGLIPNMFPDGSNEGLYHTADATMWFFHAVARYVQYTEDRDTLALMLPVLRSIVDHHIRGTRFGIGVDERDGLLREGAEGYQLTWMDAKVGDWVVTPRGGKPVEINALWYNALRLLERWLRDFGFADESRDIAQRADRVRQSFNERFWYADGGYLYDVVDGPDGDSTEFRPNQLFALSLDHPVLESSRWATVLEKVQARLVTPVGLRSLAPGSPGYRGSYAGDLWARDAAYHQGTVWAWLIGPWIDAWLRVHPDDRANAARFLDGILDSVSDFGVGTIAEIFDAEEPYAARGCISQAWSVAETLRCLAQCTGHADATRGEHGSSSAPAAE